MEKNPGFIGTKTPAAMEEDIGLANPIAEALKRKRKIMAAKRNVDEPALDSFGNPTIEPEENNG